jgi:hypothetical protein
MKGRGADGDLPIPADLFLSAEYRTYYDEVYARADLPERTRLLGQSIPLRWKEVEMAGQALQPAEDWFVGATAALAQGNCSTGEFLRSFQFLVEAGASLVEAVHRYNAEIAEYSLAVTGGTLAPESIAVMLLGRRALEDGGAPSNLLGSAPSGERPSAAVAGGPEQSEGVAPAMHVDQTGRVSGNSESNPAGGWERLPPPPEEFRAVPGGKPLGEEVAPAGGPPASVSSEAKVQSQPLVPVEQNQPATSSEQEGPKNPPSPQGEGRPAQPSFSQETRQVFRPVIPPSETAFRRYAALENLSGKEARTLVNAYIFGFSEERLASLKQSLPGVITRWSLEECLERARPADRRIVVEAYWRLAAAWAEWLVLEDELGLVEEMATVVFHNRQLPGNAEGLLELRAVRYQILARAAQMRRNLLEAQLELAQLIQWSGASEIFVPSTLPHVGGYDLQWERLPATQQEDLRLRRLAMAVSGVGETLQPALEALVAADRACALELLSLYSRGTGVSTAVQAVRLFFEMHRHWIAEVVNYNMAIVNYVDAVVPRELSAGELAAALVPRRGPSP